MRLLNKDYLFFGIILILSIFSINYCFSVVGFPSDQRNKALDRDKVNRLNNLSYTITSYYNTSKVLPFSSQEISEYNKILDPESQTPYTYIRLSDTEYQLCATFAAASTNTQSKHKKGYDCLKYTVPVYNY